MRIPKFLYVGCPGNTALAAPKHGINIGEISSRFPDSILLSTTYSPYIAAHTATNQYWGIVEIDMDYLVERMVFAGCMSMLNFKQPSVFSYLSLGKKDVGRNGLLVYADQIPRIAVNRVFVYDSMQNSWITSVTKQRQSPERRRFLADWFLGKKKLIQEWFPTNEGLPTADEMISIVYSIADQSGLNFFYNKIFLELAEAKRNIRVDSLFATIQGETV